MASADPVARAKGVRLVLGGDARLPVHVDPAEFGRVLRNLLSTRSGTRPRREPSRC